ncbi:MAG: isomerizing glutamine--fructose-6-phosphate transaminase, partial [Christensenellaceae bacterium]|nr:isomerizing glutamine--fructose-6-phosphate transaminase [Christensenellaceae bacterium]
EKEYNEAAQACVAPGAFDCEAFCLNAILKVAARLKGAFAIAVLSKHTPSAVYAARCESPLAVGYNEDGFYLLSDIDALSEFTSLGTPLDNKSAAVISLSDGIKFVRFDGTESAQRFSVLEKSDKKTHGDTEKQFKGDKMLAEIYETPSALEKCALNFPFYDSEFFRRIPLNSFDEIRFIGCGTAYHAALHGAFLTRKLCKKLTVSAHLASEYLYDNYREDTSVLLVLVSQSGETADTLGVLRRAQKNRTYCLAVVNCESSALAREADFCIFTKAGREVAVASTKAYNTQLLILTLLAYNIAGARGQTTVSKLNNAYETAKKIGSYAAAALENECAAKAIAQEIKEKKDVFFIGRGLDSFCALEGALKLKEVSYIHAEGFAAGELKHGSIALIEDGTPVIALLTQPETAQKTQNGIEEVKARGAAIHRLTVANSGKKSKADRCNLVLPHIENADFLPVIATIPLNFVAYYTALYKGCDADKPRNLAKSVTVE